MIETCRDCTAGLDHCHGSLVIHLDATIECTEVGCVNLDGTRHGLARLTCVDIDGACVCLPDSTELLVAS